MKFLGKISAVPVYSWPFNKSKVSFYLVGCHEGSFTTPDN